jgi:hypothetical protein
MINMSQSSSTYIKGKMRYEAVVRYIKGQRLAWLGHLERMHEERTTKKISLWKPLSSRPKGRPKKKWKDVQDLQIMKIKSWKTCVRRKEQWKETAELAKTHSGLYSCYRRTSVMEHVISSVTLDSQ